jgi:hypothetical protein
MNKSDFKVGQIVYGKPGINISRYSKEVIEGTIEKIGNKYIDVKFGRTYKYQIEDLRQKTEYAEDYYLYLDKQQIFDEEESESLIRDIKLKFSGWGNVSLTLDQLRRIKVIIDEN